MPQRELSRQTRRLSIAVYLAGALLALATVTATALLARSQYLSALQQDKEEGELQSRVLADHASRAVDTTSVVLAYLAGQLKDAQADKLSERASASLPSALAALPFVRALAVLDANGKIVASTQDTETGQQCDVSKLGGLPDGDAEVLGDFVAGRGLLGMASQARPGVGFIPVKRAIATEHGPRHYLVALLNPDAFSNFQLLTLNDPNSSAYLLSYAGRVLVSSGAQALPAGATAGTHAIFTHYLPATEHAVFVADGISTGRQVVAYRVSKTRPLVVVVEQPYADTLQRWQEDSRSFIAAAVVTVLFILFLTWLVHRTLHARALAQDQLDLARQDVVRRERDLRILIRSVQELIFRTDAQGRISYVNDRWFALSGQNAEQALGQPLAGLVNAEDRASIAALFDTNSQAGVRQASASLRSFDGTVHRLDIAMVPLRSNTGVTGFAGSAVDVTDRYAAQQELQHQLAFVALLLEISPLPVATFDEQGRYVTVNRAWEDFMGRDRDQVLGRTGATFMPTQDAAEHARQDTELWRTGGSRRYEAKVNHRDGSRRDVVVTKVLVRGDGTHASSLLSTMMDVSEFREAERATQAARDAAEESSRAKSEFVANMSHELRTPLQSILGFSELGLVRGKDQPRLAGMFGDIHASGQRMLALVNDLLDVSKIESAVGAITLERGDLRGMVQEVLAELRPQLTARALQLEVDLGPGALVAKVDPVRFAQVVRNVAANAIKFSPQGGTIEVRGRLLVAEREVCISVRDHGVGIPEKELEKIFEAFVQSSTTKDGSGGTGLGLAICRKIMDAHGGRIAASNMPDGGALFQILLPARIHLDRDTTY